MTGLLGRRDELRYGDSCKTAQPLAGVNYLLFRIEARTERDDWDSLSAIRQPREDAVKMLQAQQVEQAEAHLRRAIAAALIAL